MQHTPHQQLLAGAGPAAAGLRTGRKTVSAQLNIVAQPRISSSKAQVGFRSLGQLVMSLHAASCGPDVAMLTLDADLRHQVEHQDR